MVGVPISRIDRRNHGGVDRALLSFDLVAGMSTTNRIRDEFTISKSDLHILVPFNSFSNQNNFEDLSPAFHWNIKQLFVFVVAEYESEANVS